MFLQFSHFIWIQYNRFFIIFHNPSFTEEHVAVVPLITSEATQLFSQQDGFAIFVTAALPHTKELGKSIS